MTIHILLGIGGTGAKVAEAIIQATAAGMGPDTLQVGFIDQDQANGNTARAANLVRAIREARRQWRTTGDQQFIDGPGPLAAAIDFFDGEDGLWVPHADRSMTLRSAFGDLGSDQHALDVFFRPGEDEQDMPLNIGYKAKPFIGSAAITAAIGDGQDPFWHRLDQLIGRAATGEEVRLLLAGSVFGGTGAAGFPTIAKLIRDKVRAAGRELNFRLAGALMLPYFHFEAASSGAQGQAANVANADELLVQSRGALRYYKAMMGEQHVFDDVYLVGWNPPTMLPYHAPGEDRQRNPALLPELVAAAGACRFLRNGADPKKRNVFVSMRAEEAAFGWADLPSPDSTEAYEPYLRLGQAVRFAVAWKYYAPLMGHQPSVMKKLFGGHPFYKRQLLNQVNYKEGAVEAAMSAMSRYVDALLVWAASIQAYAVSSGVTFLLWDVARAVEPIDTSQPDRPVMPLGSIDADEDIRAAYGAALRPPAGSEPPPTAGDLINELTVRAAPGNHKGLGQMLASLHAGAAVVKRRA